MSFRPLNTQNSQLQNYGQINDMIRSLNREQTVKAFKQAGGNAIVTGRLPDNLGYGTILYDSSNNPLIYMAVDDGQPILKVAKPGKNAITGTDADLIFNSANNVFKIVGEGAGTFPTANPSTSGTGFAGDGQTTEITHSLGFVPIVLAFIDFGGQYLLTPWTNMSQHGADGANMASFYVSADSTKLYVQTSALIYRSGADTEALGGFSFKYYLLQETAN